MSVDSFKKPLVLQVSKITSSYSDGRKQREYFPWSDVLTYYNYKSGSKLFHDDDAHKVASLANEYLAAILRGENSIEKSGEKINVGFIQNNPYDQGRGFGNSEITHDLFGFSEVLKYSDYIYSLGEKKRCTYQEQAQYNFYKKHFLIAIVFLQEYETQITFRLKAMKFPRQTNDKNPVAKWRGGGIVINNNETGNGLFYQCRWCFSE